MQPRIKTQCPRRHLAGMGKGNGNQPHPPNSSLGLTSRPPAPPLTEVGGPQPVRAESGLWEWSSEGPPPQDWVLGGGSWSQPRPTCTHFLLLNKRIFVEQWRECPRGGASLSPPSPPQLRWLHRPRSGPRGGPWLFLLPSSLGPGWGSIDPAPPWPGVAVSWLL